MRLNNLNNSILSNEDFENINLNNLDFQRSFIFNDLPRINLNSNISDSYKNTDSKKDFSISRLVNRQINNFHLDLFDNYNKSENFNTDEDPEKAINFKKEDISNESTIFTKGIYDNYSKQIIYEAMNETNKQSKKSNNKSFRLFTQYPKKHNKKKKNILSRKENSDNIRKKIKTRFLKSLKNKINTKIERAGSKYLFRNLPYSFVSNLSKEINKKVFCLTLKEIFQNNLSVGKKTNADYKNHQHNLFVLNYLENNKAISEKSNFNVIKNMKISEIFKEYLESKEFGSEISTLKQDNENEKYIKDYIVKASNFLNFLNKN